MKLLVTGGCGFIGSNFVRMVLGGQKDVRVTNMDALTYAGNLENLQDVSSDPRYRFVKGGITDGKLVSAILKDDGIDAVVNFAAESHVDRSIYEPAAFLTTNVLGTQVLLESCRERGVPRFVQVSTDEVYGSAPPGKSFTETDALHPSSPYSASKASADLMVEAYARTFGYEAIITRCTNNYGPYQFPEKLIPLFVTNAQEDRELPVYGDGMNVRDWIYVEDHCRAILTVLEKGKPGAIYNVAGKAEKTNMEITRTVLKLTGKPETLIKYVKDRPGHDRRYSLDASKIERELGWRPSVDFEEGIRRTVEWYTKQSGWWKRVKSGEYRDFYRKHYGM